MVSPSSSKLLSPKDCPGESPASSLNAARASTGGSSSSTTNTAATIIETSSIRGEPGSEMGTQTSDVHSFFDQLKDQASNGCCTEQWEARKALAMEIEWRED